MRANTTPMTLRYTNPGRRERAARRRHKRTVSTTFAHGSDPVTRKLGRKHQAREWRKAFGVGDRRKTSKSETCD